MQFVQKFIPKENKNWFPRWIHARVRKINDKWIKISTDIPVNITQKNWRLQTRKIVKSIKYVPSTGKTNIYDFQNNSSKYATANESALEILMWC